jgi:hypothetical protein
MEPSLLIWFFVVALALTGLAGLILPGIPGAPLLFVAALLAAWAENFEYIGIGTLSILAVLAVLTYGVDLWDRRRQTILRIETPSLPARSGRSRNLPRFSRGLVRSIY